MKTAPSLRMRSDATGAGSQIPPAPAATPLRMEDLEMRIRCLESMLGRRAEGDDIDAWMYSAEGIAEFRAAIREMAIYHRTNKLAAYCNKTNGRVPRLEER